MRAQSWVPRAETQEKCPRSHRFGGYRVQKHRKSALGPIVSVGTACRNTGKVPSVPSFRWGLRAETLENRPWSHRSGGCFDQGYLDCPCHLHR